MSILNFKSQQLLHGFLSFVLLTVLLLVSGCNNADQVQSNTENSEQPKIEYAVKVLIVDAADLWEPLQRQWSAQTDGTLEVTNVTADDVFSDGWEALPAADLIIYPSVYLAQLVADEKILPLADEVWDSEQLDNKGLMRDCRSRLIRFGRERWATPISNPYSLMFLRADVLADLEVRTPSSWNELVNVHDRLEAKGDVAGVPGTVLVPTKGTAAANSLLAIAAAEVRHRGKLDAVFDRSNMRPLLVTEPYISALKTLKTLAGKQRLTAAETAAKFIEGKAAVAIGWPTKTSFIESESEISDAVFEHTVITRLPGSNRWFDFGEKAWQDIPKGPDRIEFLGGSSYQASVLSTASYPTAVYEFISWLSSKRVNNQIVSNLAIGAPTRYSQLGDVQAWTGDVFDVENADRVAELLNEINEDNISMNFPRIRGSHSYLKALAQAVHRCLDDELDEAQALQAAAAAWETLTDKYDRTEQSKLLRTDLGF